MSHVDEGALHAYLDGALDELPGDEGARIRAHLASCAACARRLEQERVLRDRASAILRAGDVAVDDLPSLEELRGRARTRASAGVGRTRSRARLHRLAWAASVVAALGTGWSLRQVTAPGGALAPALEGGTPVEEAAREVVAEDGRVPAARANEARPADAAAAARDEATDAGSRVDGAAAERDEVTAAARRDEVAGAREAAEREARTEGERFAAPDARVPLEEKAVATPAEAQPAAVETATRRVAAPTPALSVEVPLIFRTDSAGLALPSRLGVRVGAQGALFDAPPRAWEAGGDSLRPAMAAGDSVLRPASFELRRRVAGAIDRGEGPRSHSLVVPGLTVIAVARLDGGRASGAVRVLQLMADGDTLELLHLPAGTMPEALARTQGDARNELVLARAGGWIVARAHAPAAVLRSLVDRLPPAR